MENKQEKIKNIINQLLPKQSKEIYDRWYMLFKIWQNTNNLNNINEDNLFLYIDKISQKYAPSSLWTIYSCIKKKLLVEESIDISNYLKVIALLNVKNNEYLAKNATIFTREDVDNFLEKAGNDLYLREKLIVIIAIAGGMRSDELINLKFEDLILNKEGIKITITKSKSKTDRT